MGKHISHDKMGAGDAQSTRGWRFSSSVPKTRKVGAERGGDGYYKPVARPWVGCYTRQVI